MSLRYKDLVKKLIRQTLLTVPRGFLGIYLPFPGVDTRGWHQIVSPQRYRKEPEGG
jgi:hypothetical protein